MTLTALVTEAPETPVTPGDLRNATVAFIDRGTGGTIATVNVAANGTASYVWTPAMGAATQKTFTIGFVVSNFIVGYYYNRNSTADNALIVVSK